MNVSELQRAAKASGRKADRSAQPKRLSADRRGKGGSPGHKSGDQAYHNWVLANQRMAAVMKAKGYHYHFDFCKNAGHVDGKVLDQTLPGALEWLWRGYPIK